VATPLDPSPNGCPAPLAEDHGYSQVRGRLYGAPLPILDRRFGYSNVQVGVLDWPFVLGDGLKLPVQVTTSSPPWLIVSV
jgi:hypothetical protein